MAQDSVDINGGNGSNGSDRIVWSHCGVNCGSRCVFKWHVRDTADGPQITWMETDDISPEDLQARACLRGRAMRRWINSPDRLLYPMRRIAGAARGEGRFERISWDEALDEICTRLRHTIETYGNEAVYINYGTGMHSVTGKTTSRLMHCLGGRLDSYNDYSTAMLMTAMPYMYGDPCVGNPACASSLSAAVDSDFVLMFGNSPAETRMGGANATWDFVRVREAVLARGGRIVNVDYRLSETCANHPGEWLPIRTGTDAALVAAIAHELIVNDWVDLEFVHTYCVGYDEQTMPDSARGKHLSYQDYVMGTGYDCVEKTPEWAEPITQIPAATIRKLAYDLAHAQAPFICQGWGLQRHSNGESASRAICMLPIMLGAMGRPGTNTGMRECGPTRSLVGKIPSGPNAVRVQIPVQQWANAIDHGSQMTALHDGVRGADKLSCGIKFLWNYAGNCLTNQHGDINRIHDILVDESKCETIVVFDTVMTDSARYADILLPETMLSERFDVTSSGDSEYAAGVTVGGPAQKAPGECRSAYEVNAEIARRMGVGEQFTRGLTQGQWAQRIYEAGRRVDPDMPSWDDINARGVYREALEPNIGFKDFIADPVAHPLNTPSGKIEIYSQSLDNLAHTWGLEWSRGVQTDDPDGFDSSNLDRIWPIPAFDPGFEGYGSVTQQYPLYLSGFHGKARAHSSYGFIKELQAVCPDALWINPLDAQSRGIANGDLCAVKSPAGEIRVPAYVTGRIIPGTVGLPQGAWHQADMSATGDRVDWGACINTLSTYHPSPLAKGNGWANSVICQVSRASESQVEQGIQQGIQVSDNFTALVSASSTAAKNDDHRGQCTHILCNTKRCTGCLTCVIACQDYHDLPASQSLREVITREIGGWKCDDYGNLTQDVAVYHASRALPGCDVCSARIAVGKTPVCVSACPLRALRIAQ